jgi:hypothetical protein
MKRALALSILLAVVGPAFGQDEAVQSIYASMEGNVRREYEAVLVSIDRSPEAADADAKERMRSFLKVVYYNKAVLFARCAAEAEQQRSPGARRVPAEHNLILTTCVEEKMAELNKFTNVRSYAGIFFPERIKPCGEASRLREQEKLLPPYAFLKIAEPKLYDFARYSTCVMASKPTSLAAR